MFLSLVFACILCIDVLILFYLYSYLPSFILNFMSVSIKRFYLKSLLLNDVEHHCHGHSP